MKTSSGNSEMIPGWQVKVPPSTLQGQSADWANWIETKIEKQKIEIFRKIIFADVWQGQTNPECWSRSCCLRL